METTAFDAETMKKKLEPSHLKPPDIEQMKEDIAEKANPAKEATEEKVDKAVAADPRSKTPYTFKFDWKDARGKRWSGSFTTKILTGNEVRMAGILQARLNGGMPGDALDGLTSEINYILARTPYCLVEKPEWFEKVMDAPDSVPLLQAIYKEVDSYEGWFRKHGKVENAG